MSGRWFLVAALMPLASVARAADRALPRGSAASDVVGAADAGGQEMPPAMRQLEAGAGSTGAQRSSNVRISDLWRGITQLRARTQRQRRRQYGELKTDRFHALPTGSRHGVTGGQGLVMRNVPSGHCVGTDGAGPCVGLVLVSPDGSARAFHFTAGDDPNSTLRRLRDIPKGTRAAICGGDGSSISNATLQGVCEYLDANSERITVDGYANATGVWWEAGERPGQGRWVFGRSTQYSVRPPGSTSLSIREDRERQREREGSPND